MAITRDWNFMHLKLVKFALNIVQICSIEQRNMWFLSSRNSKSGKEIDIYLHFPVTTYDIQGLMHSIILVMRIQIQNRSNEHKGGISILVNLAYHLP